MIRDYLLANGYKDSSQKNGNLVKYDGNVSVVFTAEMIELMNVFVTHTAKDRDGWRELAKKSTRELAQIDERWVNQLDIAVLKGKIEELQAMGYTISQSKSKILRNVHVLISVRVLELQEELGKLNSAKLST